MTAADFQSARPQPPASPEPPPTRVARAAAERGLGALGYAQKGGNPFAKFGRGMAYGLGWLVAGCGLGLLFYRLHLGPLRIAAVPFLVGAGVAILTGFRRLFGGFTATYLYANGLIHTKNRRIQVVTWPEVDRLTLWEIGGRLDRYQVVTHDGRKVPVELESAQGDATLGNVLRQIVHTLGRPIAPGGPSARMTRWKQGGS